MISTQFGSVGTHITLCPSITMVFMASLINTLNFKIHPMVKILSLFLCEKFLVPFFTTIEVVAPLENDPILSDRLIRSVRHLELQNLSNG